MKIKNIVHIIIITMLLGCFSYHFFFGKNGFYQYKKLAVEMDHVAVKLSACQQEAGLLEASIAQWQDGDFYKEKLAREAMLFVGPQEYVYVVPHALT